MLVAGHLIPDTELEWRFGPSGGPGGQHANRSHTRAELSFDLTSSAVLPAPLKEHMLRRLGKRAVTGTLTVVADETRSQTQNRRLAMERMTGLLNEAAHYPRRRRPTRPTAASREKRLDQKRRRSSRKRERRGEDW
ncbi:MAG TPA: alternative ribosome rescue aminoacyl-tRNA hydrolase ArfB [Acidimicrobiia bacterium]